MYQTGKEKIKRGSRHEAQSFYGEEGGTSIERKFDAYWRMIAHGLPEPTAQYRFDEKRKWMIDRAWPEYKLAVELNGAGGGGYGRAVKCHVCGAAVRARKADGSIGKMLLIPYASHASGENQKRDAEKSNALTIAGWHTLTYTSMQLDESPAQVIEETAALLESLMRSK